LVNRGSQDNKNEDKHSAKNGLNDTVVAKKV
jgi:hypothetical protein